MKIKVHEFRMADVDDVEIFAAQPIWEWQQTDAGKWVMEHSEPAPVWTTGWDQSHYGRRITITADLREEDATYFNLKWGIK